MKELNAHFLPALVVIPTKVIKLPEIELDRESQSQFSSPEAYLDYVNTTLTSGKNGYISQQVYPDGMCFSDIITDEDEVLPCAIPWLGAKKTMN